MEDKELQIRGIFSVVDVNSPWRSFEVSQSEAKELFHVLKLLRNPPCCAEQVGHCEFTASRLRILAVSMVPARRMG
jgi:hypothetical protein